jgi:large subunit ribosomal protein L10
VGQLAELRRSLGETTNYTIVKNTLTKLAARDAGIDAFEDLLVGPSAIAFVKGDPVVAAKGLRDFAKAHPMLVIKGALLDGAPLDAAGLSQLADLESREVLLAKLAGAMKAKMGQAAALFAAPLSQAARLVDALRAKVEETAPADEAPADDAPAAEAAEAPADEAPTAEAAETPVAGEAADS